jgi:type IV pilus assembly protein PilQ
MNKTTVCAILLMLIGLFAWAGEVVLDQVTLSRQGDQVLLALEATGSLVYTSYAGPSGAAVVELVDTTLGPAVPPRLESGALGGAVTLAAQGGNVVITLPSAAGAEPRITSDGRSLLVALDAPSRVLLQDVEVAFDASGPVVKVTGENLPTPRLERLTGPDRLVLDFPGAVNQSKHGAYFINQEELARVRVSQFQLQPSPVARVVLETPLSAQARVEPSDGGVTVRLGRTPEPAAPAAAEVQAEAPRAALPDFTVQEAAPVPAPQEDATKLYEVQTLGRQETKFTGDPISFNLKEAPISDVLQTFAELTGLNFVLDPGVNSKVTVRLDQVPWDQALELILKINGLGYVLENNVMRIAPITRLAQEAQQKRQLEKEEDLNQPVQTIIKRLSYSRASQIQTNIKKVMSERGDLFVDDRTNTLIMMDIEKYMVRVLNLIKALDVPPRQVQIEARIVETTKNFTQQLGIAWGFTGRGTTLYGNTTGWKFPSTYVVTGDVNLPAGNQILDMTFGNILGSFNLDVSLYAAEQDGLVKIISSPRVITQDNLGASIQSGVQIPVQTTSNNTTTVQYINATLSLKVTPQITEAGTISMQIDVQKREPLLGLTVTGGTNAPLSTRDAQTQVMVKDGGTTVIGGIYQITDNNSQNRIPFLHRIPIIGNLFKDRSIQRRHDELLIFITPRIVKSY